MDYYEFGEKFNLEQSNNKKILLKHHFIKDEYIESSLLWCSLKEKPLRFTFEDAKQLVIPNANSIYFYLERSNKMYITTTSNIFSYIEQLEPWIDIDAYIFDDSYMWLLVITHEDYWLSIGL